MRWAVALVVLAGCGRIGFDAVGGNGDGGLDATVIGRWAHVSTSGRATCAITLAGELYCWGSAYGSGLANGSQHIQPILQVGTATDWTSISLADNHGCGLRAGTDLWCWGNNNHGQLPGKPLSSEQLPYQIAGSYLQVAASGAHTCAIKSDHSLWCIGEGAFGVLGTNSTADQPALVRISAGIDSWRTVTTATFSTCAIQTDDSLWCWGYNDFAQLGAGDQSVRLVPTKIGTKQWQTVDIGSTHGCGSEVGGATSCWGQDNFGEVGTPGVMKTVPTTVPGAPALASTDVGDFHSCGLTATADLYCWGDGEAGQTGGMVQQRLTPTKIASAVTELSTNEAVTCFISDARLFCGGNNNYGQAGPPAGEADVPRQSDTRTDWAQIDASGKHACALTTAGRAYCWGDNLIGELGTGAPFNEQHPRDTQQSFAAIVLGNYLIGARGMDGSLWIAGEQPNLTTVTNTFVQVYPANSGVDLAAGDDFGCRVLPDQSMRCGGENTRGQLGDGTMTNSSATGPAGTWKYVRADSSSTCAIAATNQLECWGDNTAGQLGNGGTATTLSPATVALPGTPSQISMGYLFTCVLLTNGRIYCSGAGDYGQLGPMGLASSTTPIPLDARTDWIEVAAGDKHACAIAADHSLWCWGHTDAGQTGVYNDANPPTPTRVGTDTDWSHVTCGEHFTCALKTNGTRWCFGNNESGELGDGRSWREDFTVIP